MQFQREFDDELPTQTSKPQCTSQHTDVQLLNSGRLSSVVIFVIAALILLFLAIAAATIFLIQVDKGVRFCQSYKPILGGLIPDCSPYKPHVGFRMCGILLHNGIERNSIVVSWDQELLLSHFLFSCELLRKQSGFVPNARHENHKRIFLQGLVQKVRIGIWFI